MAVLKQAYYAIKQGIAHLFIELPAHRVGMDRLIDRLEQSGQSLGTRAAAAKGRTGSQRTFQHIIGIERWGQRRLRVALGEPLIDEEYDPYCPAAADWQQLVAAFRSTRQETISLGKSLRMAGVDPHTRVLHNQLGDITILGWLYYLNLHARIEGLRINE